MTPLSSHCSQSFLFTPETLAQKIVQESDFSLTGYWQHCFQTPGQTATPSPWYLALVEGKAIFSDGRPMSVSPLLSTIERYVPRLRTHDAKQLSESLREKFVAYDDEHQLELLPVFLSSCYHSNLVRPDEVKHALRLKLLQDLDDVLFDYAGQAKFLPAPALSDHVPLMGFDLHKLMAEAHKRRLIWDKVKTLIPSPDTTLTINEAAVRRANLAPQHEHHLRVLVSQGNTLNAIATALAQDTLEIAKGLVQLVEKGLLTIQSTIRNQDPEILIIDDSPVMLQQFKQLVTSWGYKVRSHSDPTSALEVMTRSNPIAIFLDINMPGLSGFDLLKQIRRQPKLANIPLIMLTAERTLSNNWRAQWSGCKFLSKPLSAEEIPNFKQELRILLESTID